MSNPDRPLVSPHAVRASVVATRWWWVRHAPVREDGGCIYGQKDIGCDTSDREVFEAVAKILPRHAVWYASNLKRTHQTADAIWAAGFPQAVGHAARAGARRAASRRVAGLEPRGVPRQPAARCSYWFAPIDEPAPGGESFMDLYNRVRGAIERINVEHAGRDVIAVAHGGTIKAAVGLALGDQPEKGLAFDHRQLLGDAARSSRQRRSLQLADCRWSTSSPGSRMRRTTPMHQPAGPEIAAAGKLA